MGEASFPFSPCLENRRRENWVRQVDGISPPAAEGLYIIQRISCSVKVSPDIAGTKAHLLLLTGVLVEIRQASLLVTAPDLHQARG